MRIIIIINEKNKLEKTLSYLHLHKQFFTNKKNSSEKLSNTK